MKIAGADDAEKKPPMTPTAAKSTMTPSVVTPPAAPLSVKSAEQSSEQSVVANVPAAPSVRRFAREIGVDVTTSAGQDRAEEFPLKT